MRLQQLFHLSFLSHTEYVTKTFSSLSFSSVYILLYSTSFVALDCHGEFQHGPCGWKKKKKSPFNIGKEKPLSLHLHTSSCHVRHQGNHMSSVHLVSSVTHTGKLHGETLLPRSPCDSGHRKHASITDFYRPNGSRQAVVVTSDFRASCSCLKYKHRLRSELNILSCAIRLWGFANRLLLVVTHAF